MNHVLTHAAAALVAVIVAFAFGPLIAAAAVIVVAGAAFALDTRNK